MFSIACLIIFHCLTSFFALFSDCGFLLYFTFVSTFILSHSFYPHGLADSSSQSKLCPFLSFLDLSYTLHLLSILRDRAPINLFYLYSSLVIFFFVSFLRRQLDWVSSIYWFFKILIYSYMYAMCFFCVYSIIVMYICALSKVKVRIF